MLNIKTNKGCIDPPLINIRCSTSLIFTNSVHLTYILNQKNTNVHSKIQGMKKNKKKSPLFEKQLLVITLISLTTTKIRLHDGASTTVF